MTTNNILQYIIKIEKADTYRENLDSNSWPAVLRVKYVQQQSSSPLPYFIALLRYLAVCEAFSALATRLPN